MVTLKPNLPTYSIDTIWTHGHPHHEAQVFRFEYFARDIERLKSSHRHHFYSFVLVLGGTGSHDIDFNTYAIQTNRLFMIAPGQVHAWNELKNVTGYFVMFTDSFVALSKGRKLMNAWPLFRAGQPGYVDLDAEEAGVWTEKCQQMEVELRSPDPFSKDAVFYAIGSLLVRAARLWAVAETERVPQDLLTRYQDLIEEHYMQKRKPKEYAALLNVSPNHLNAVIKKRSGKSAGELIRQRVILEAKRNLAHTRLSIAEIAFQLGFEDNSYFGRFFKKYSGLTPQKFREKQQN